MDFTVRSRRINRSNKRSSINATLSGSISQTNAVPSLAKLGSAAAVIVLAVGWHLVPLPRFGWLSHSSDVITVISTAGPDSVARKQRLMLEQRQPSNYYRVHSIILNPDQQRTFVQANGCGIKRFNELGERHQEHLAVELFKYCALSKQVGDALYVDANSPLIVPLDDVLAVSTSFAVLGYAYFPETIHGSLLMLRKDQNYLAREMVQLIVDTPIDVLEASPLLIQRTLYKLIVDSVSATSTTHAPKQRHTLLPGKNGNGWFLFEQKCRMNPLRRLNGWATQNSDEKKTFSCPAKNEFCCSVQDSSRKQVVVMNRHPTLPYQRITETMREPYNAGKGFYAADELPYISTVREVTFKRPKDMPQTKNLYELFYDNDKLPSIRCIRCLHLKSCLDFKRYCVKYLKDLCAEPPPTKFVAKEITVTPPLYRRDPSRLVPRIVHQTWYETMDPEKYPNMSRLVESWKRSGWEYKFYSDEDAEQFLSTHFPREVLEAYQSLIPGAFKADLFRYCALLIHGGVYADVDIMLESSLDVVVEPDVGFMVPMDVVRILSVRHDFRCVRLGWLHSSRTSFCLSFHTFSLRDVFGRDSLRQRRVTRFWLWPFKRWSTKSGTSLPRLITMQRFARIPGTRCCTHLMCSLPPDRV